MKLSGGQLIIRTLEHIGISRLFSLPGHQILSVYDACIDSPIDLISTRHEASAVFMAQASAYTGREPGAVLLAGGPELTNALTGIAQCYYAGVPMVVISGANTLKKRDRGFPQDMDQLDIVRPFTKWARGCHDTSRIPEYIGTAYRHAIRGKPGPAYVEIPYDVMERSIPGNSVVMPGKPSALPTAGEESAVVEMAEILLEAERPVAIAGSGALWSGAGEELVRFSKKTDIPLFLTTGALAMPFPPAASFGLGSVGAGRPSLQAISRSDVILLLGTRMNFLLGFGQPPFISPRQKIIQIDINSVEIDNNRQVDLGIAGDLRTILQQFNQLEVPGRDFSAWREKLSRYVNRFQQELNALADGSHSPMHPLRLIKEIETVRTEDSLLVLDGANSILWSLMMAAPRPRGGVIISTLGDLEAIGAGVPQALALKRAYPDRQIILHTGDGSLGYGFMEMETAIRYDIPLVVIVHNDRGWGMTRDMQKAYFGDHREIGNQLGVIRYDRMTEALGGHGEFVENPRDLGPALERALKAGVAACVNVMVDPRPKSPGLMMFMLMEVMLGKESYFDRIPGWMRRLQTLGLDRLAGRAMVNYLDRQLHREMK